MNAKAMVTVPVTPGVRVRLDRIREAGVPLARIVGAGLLTRIAWWEERLGLDGVSGENLGIQPGLRNGSDPLDEVRPHAADAEPRAGRVDPEQSSGAPS